MAVEPASDHHQTLTVAVWPRLLTLIKLCSPGVDTYKLVDRVGKSGRFWLIKNPGENASCSKSSSKDSSRHHSPINQHIHPPRDILPAWQSLPTPIPPLRLLRAKGMANVIDKLFAGARLKCCCRLDACESPSGEMNHRTTLKSAHMTTRHPVTRNSRF
ncbi:hypothetical protein PSTT_00242 [Puccinia striiformis]|uniref:Uncharacterized protein n=1 Tax=Puccinia striiformis TaxID=27350 RepID=A0A2S4W814_9BASI|nr:hypothetical protein PSTT_00242 [Puccinia striiformis]